MPTLKDLLSLICQHSAEHGGSFGQECAREMERIIRQNWPTERVYIPPNNSRIDPERGEAIRQAAKRLPTGVVAERFGISRQLVSYHLRKRR